MICLNGSRRAFRGFQVLILLCCAVLAVLPVLAAQEKVYQDIPFDARGPEVLELQTRLKDLEYYLDGMTLDPEHFDGDTQRAVEVFCAQNQIQYDGTGVTAALQQIIFSNSAKKYAPPPEEKRPLPDRISEYMMKDTGVAGLVLPMYVIWLAAALLLVLIGAVVIRFFVQPDRTRVQPANEPDRAAENEAGIEDVFRESSGGIRQERSRKLRLQVKYRGNVRNVVLDCSEPVTIGRGDTSLVLDESDEAASGKHCSLYYKGELLILRDHSTNGTEVNGSLIHNCECRLPSGSRIRVSEHQIMVEYAD